MKKRALLLIGALLLASCASLPDIRPVADEKTTCPSPFPAQKIRFIHTIEAVMAGKTKASMIGVTLADPVSRTLSCAVMSPEGMVLFEALRGPSGLSVNRALPPFDAADFARNMMDDIELIFFEPRGALARKGVLAKGEAVCRRHEDQGGWIDVWEDHDGRVHIRRYSEGGRLQRSVTLMGGPANAYAAIDLQASEWVGYSLSMTLIESETVQNDPQIKE
jgi:hypothetical protein